MRLSNAKLVLGTIIIVVALVAQFYNKKFPENRDFLICCIGLYPFFSFFVCQIVASDSLDAFYSPRSLRFLGLR